ncbi:MAG: alpha/beta fold hydrolase [Deltaproteobacteria bacterium]|nr:MAG: alpha/beta fold hydrolase [Deltaproteobacteria bacterium]
MAPPTTLLTGVLLGLGLGLLLGLLLRRLARLARRRLSLTTACDEVHWPVTSDGWRLALYRYRPRRPEPGAPVILCHGLGANRFNLDFGAERSLARHLAEAGFDVFVLELRGAGRSRQLPTGAPREDGFDAHVQKDAPAALRWIERVTGHRRVLWVGHSMGGMIGYALAGGAKAGRLAGLVAIGSPAVFGSPPRLFHVAARLTRALLRCVRPGRGLFRGLAPLVGWVRLPGERLIYNPAQLEGAVARRALYNLVEWALPGQLTDFLRWMASGRFDSRDGAVDYLGALARAEVPALFIAGAADALAPPSAIRPAYEALGCRDKRYLVLGGHDGDEGAGLDFGHGDLLLGRHAPAVVYPQVAAWLRAHSEGPARGEAPYRRQADGP